MLGQLRPSPLIIYLPLLSTAYSAYGHPTVEELDFLRMLALVVFNYKVQVRVIRVNR